MLLLMKGKVGLIVKLMVQIKQGVKLMLFRKKNSLNDHRELYGVDKTLKEIEHRIHEWDSAWHDTWKERLRDFNELEKRVYPDGNPKKEGYKIA